MTRAFEPPDPEAVARVRALADRRLSADEFAAYVDAPWTSGELEEKLALIRWFQRRYPTPGLRLAYARRKYQEWSQSFPR